MLCITKNNQFGLQILKSQYGLKQVAQQWNIKFDTFLNTCDLVINEVDPSVYHNKGPMETICKIFVDDEILCIVKELAIDNIIMHLKTIFSD